jgi:hypothetical protein
MSSGSNQFHPPRLHLLLDVCGVENKFHLVTYECDFNKGKIDLTALARGFPQHTLSNSFFKVPGTI